MRLRSLLFVPGDRPDRMEKALGLGADALILDLEDAVTPARKGDARAAIRQFLSEYPGKGRGPAPQQATPGPRPSPGHSAPFIFIRINPLDGGMTAADLDAAEGADGIVLPKSEGAGSLFDLDRLLEKRNDQRTKILPIATETPAAIFRLGDYGDVTDRLCGLTWGAEDLPAAIGAATSREIDGRYTAPYELARSLTLFGAHAAGVPAIETVYLDFRDLDGLAAYAARGARDGFTGMMAVHPAQLPAINAAFTPSEEAIAQAQRMIDAFAAKPGAGAIAIDGKMYDLPHLKAARRVLEG